ncbi:hypothetical protein EV368DRAFT_68192 [Lentinula lateritia]|nr:hypothetical protein EV368DRAFT_68192 [Lentinula lateritia]
MKALSTFHSTLFDISKNPESLQQHALREHKDAEGNKSKIKAIHYTDLSAFQAPARLLYTPEISRGIYLKSTQKAILSYTVNNFLYHAYDSRRGLATRARKILFGISIFMFLLSTVYWIASISTLIQLIQVWFLASDPDAHSAPNYLPILNALAFVNYIITDGVVVWRAWVLCSGDGTKALTMCLFMLGLATVSVTATIVIRISLMVIDTQVGELFNQLNHGINVAQVATLVLSLLTNSLATFLISLKAWRSRTEIRNNLDSAVDRHSRAGKIFALLVETGVVYSLSCLTVFVSSLIPLKEGTLGDLYTPVNI